MSKLINLCSFKYQFFFALLVIISPITNILSNNIAIENIEYIEVFYSFWNLLILFCLISFTLFFFKIKSKKNFVISALLFYIFFLFRIFEILILKTSSIFNLAYSYNFTLFTFFLINLFLIFFLKKFYKLQFQKFIIIFFLLIVSLHVMVILKKIGSSIFFKNENTVTFLGNDKFEKILFVTKPNIYLIISDMYSDSEYLFKTYNQKNSEFENFLKKNSFFVKNSHLSNYGNTSTSVASLLSMKYFTDEFFFNDNIKINFNKIILENDNVSKVFKYNKYELDYFLCDFDYFKRKDNCYKKNNASFVSNLRVTFIEAVYYNTPLYNFFLNLKKEKKNMGIESLFFDKNNNNKSIKEKFAYLHLYLPHPPYILNSDCSYKKNLGQDKLSTNNVTLSEIQKKVGYKSNFDCATKILKKILNRIMQNDKNSIIFLISDHGPHLIKSYKKKISYLDILDKHSAFFAVRFGSNYNFCNNFYKNKNLQHVNLFRILFNCLEKKNDISYLEPLIYFKDINSNKIAPVKLKETDIISIKNEKN